MRPLSTLALTFALSLAAGTALAQQQGGQPQGGQRMDHSNMQGMDHSKMQGMDHSNMPGMDHSRPNAQGGQARQPAQQGTQQQRRSN